MGKGGGWGVNFWSGDSGFSEIAIINFTPRLLFDLLFTV